MVLSQAVGMQGDRQRLERVMGSMMRGEEEDCPLEMERNEGGEGGRNCQ